MISKEVLKRFLTIFLPLSILIIGIAAVFYFTDISNEMAIRKANEIVYVNIHKETIAGNFKAVVSDLLILADQHEPQKMFETGEDDALKKLLDNFLNFSKRKQLYDQIRFLDETGMEVARVNLNNGKPYNVPEDQLQFKGNRYYFKETIQLKRGEVFVSPFDLNIERGKVEQPLKPIIRFGTPVLDRFGKKRGVIILNYLGKKIIDDLERISANLPGHVMLINSDGYLLHSRRPEDHWGFMYEDRKDRTYGNFFPKVWQQISGAESGQFIDDEAGMFTFVTIYPLLEGWDLSAGSGKPFESSAYSTKAKKYYWKLLSHIPPDVLYAESRELLGMFFTIYTILIVLLASSSWFLAHSASQEVRLQKITLSPYNIMVTLAVLVFLSELFFMFILHFLIHVSPLVEALINATLLIVLLTPIFYFLFFRPLVLHISERKRAEEQREALIKDIHKVNVELKDFAFIVSHDLKAPLRAISTLAEWIKKDYTDVLDKEGKENINLMVGRVKRMNNLIDGILRYSRIGQVKPETVWVDSEKIARYVIDALAPPENILVRIDGTLPKILYDRTHLEQLFQNLIHNAIVHLGKPEGEVVVSCRDNNGFFEFRVRDNGVGIEKRHFDRIFKMSQSLKSRDEVESSGIGLAIVRKIVGGNGGTVWVESKVGEGSAFFFTVAKKKTGN